MRSLTHSSAGITPKNTPALPTFPTPLFHPLGTHCDTPSHNAHHPFIPRHDTFFNINNDSLLLSEQTRSQVSQAIQSGWSDSTIRRYSGAIKQFIHFCDTERVPEHLRFPADEFVLCAFAASSLHRHAGGTPRSRLSALKAWHTSHNVEWKGSARLRYVLNGVHNLAPGTSRRPPRPPINSRMLSQLVENLDLSSPIDAAVAACAATAFWGQCRLGELLPLSRSPLHPTPLPTRSALKRSLQNPHSCLLHLPCTKTHPHGQNIVLVDQRIPINPISLIKNHFRVNRVSDNQHIFSYLSTDGLHYSLSKNHFLRRCNTIWSALGYPRTTGHCFRIGGTTELLIAGTPPDVVKATGRWSSESFMRYWRSLDMLAPQYIRNIRIHSYRRKRR